MFYHPWFYSRLIDWHRLYLSAIDDDLQKGEQEGERVAADEQQDDSENHEGRVPFVLVLLSGLTAALSLLHHHATETGHRAQRAHFRGSVKYREIIGGRPVSNRPAAISNLAP